MGLNHKELEDKDIIKRAKRRVRAKKAFFISFIIWIAFSFFFWYIDTGAGRYSFEWAFYPIFFWGLGVLIQAIPTFDFFGLGKEWEKQEVKREIENRKKILEEFGRRLETKKDLDELDLEELKELRQEYRDSDFV